jgi:hypothetical protein
MSQRVGTAVDRGCGALRLKECCMHVNIRESGQATTFIEVSSNCQQTALNWWKIEVLVVWRGTLADVNRGYTAGKSHVHPRYRYFESRDEEFKVVLLSNGG